MKVRRSGEDGGVPCSECGSGGDGANMLLCDNCDAGWHLYCLPSPLARVPDGDWTFVPRVILQTVGLLTMTALMSMMIVHVKNVAQKIVRSRIKCYCAMV